MAASGYCNTMILNEFYSTISLLFFFRYPEEKSAIG